MFNGATFNTLTVDGHTLPLAQSTPVPSAGSSTKKRVSAMNTRMLNMSDHDVLFCMVSSTDGVTPATGLTITGHVRKNGQAPGNAQATIMEVGLGWYAFTGTGLAKDLNTLGLTKFWGAATGAQMAGNGFQSNAPVEILVTGRPPIDIAEGRATRLP